MWGLRGGPTHSDWYAADRALLADPNPGRTLFLFCHDYMSYSFIQNQNRVVACPAPSFFSVPVVCSGNPEVFGVASPRDPEQQAISILTSQGGTGWWQKVLADHGFKYVLLTKEVDWKAYDYLNTQPGINKVADFGSIILYRNSAAPSG